MSDNTQTNPLNVDFSHRLAIPSDDLADNIGLMTDRATGILQLLISHFERERNLIVCSALDAVQQEIRDIQALADAYSKAQRSEVNHD